MIQNSRVLQACHLACQPARLSVSSPVSFFVIFAGFVAMKYQDLILNVEF
jgi:hypothetical protein